jgi:Mce-associated membrane protein
MSGPSWYDVLGVPPDASSDEVRSAWRGGIADLDPSDRRFRSLNEAAEVLLDTQRRADYDQEIGITGQQAPVPADDAEAAGVDLSALPAPVPTSDAPARRGVPVWVLAPLAVVTILMVVAAAYLFTRPSDDSIATATTDAQAAAERDITTILGYDYRRLDADQKATDALLTPAYRQKYDSLFAQVKANAPKLKIVVTVSVIASGIVRSGNDRVQVLVFVNRTTTRTDGTQDYHDQVVATMEKVGSDWLVDNLDTNQLAQ